MLGTFLEGQIKNSLIGDRIHCEFNQLKGNDRGTVTGRFSSSNPNLQQVPKDEDKGSPVRQLFIPEKGCDWGRIDYNQIEIRLLVHYGRGAGAEDARKLFNTNKKVDYHKWTSKITGVPRKKAKILNFSLAYGAGVAAIARQLETTQPEAQEFINLYHKNQRIY